MEITRARSLLPPTLAFNSSLGFVVNTHGSVMRAAFGQGRLWQGTTLGAPGAISFETRIINNTLEPYWGHKVYTFDQGAPVRMGGCPGPQAARLAQLRYNCTQLRSQRMPRSASHHARPTVRTVRTRFGAARDRPTRVPTLPDALAPTLAYSPGPTTRAQRAEAQVWDANLPGPAGFLGAALVPVPPLVRCRGFASHALHLPAPVLRSLSLQRCELARLARQDEHAALAVSNNGTIWTPGSSTEGYYALSLPRQRLELCCGAGYLNCTPFCMGRSYTQCVVRTVRPKTCRRRPAPKCEPQRHARSNEQRSRLCSPQQQQPTACARAATSPHACRLVSAHQHGRAHGRRRFAGRGVRADQLRRARHQYQILRGAPLPAALFASSHSLRRLLCGLLLTYTSARQHWGPAQPIRAFEPVAQPINTWSNFGCVLKRHAHSRPGLQLLLWRYQQPRECKLSSRRGKAEGAAASWA